MIGYLVLVLDVSCIAFGYIQKNIPIYPKFWIYRISLMCIYILILFWTYAIIFLYIENFLDILNDIFLYVQSKYFLPYILENTKTPMCKHWEPFYFSHIRDCTPLSIASLDCTHYNRFAMACK